VEDTMQGTACTLILSCIFSFKTVLEERSIGFTELNYPAVFTLKHLIYIPEAFWSDFLSSALKQHFVVPTSV